MCSLNSSSPGVTDTLALLSRIWRELEVVAVVMVVAVVVVVAAVVVVDVVESG